MDKTLKILILEDMKTDVQLLQRAVLKIMPNAFFTVATNEKEFIERLEWGTYDIVLADYQLPTYTGLQALLYVRTHYDDLPFVFVTGSLNDEEAVARVILNGANGYILKHDMGKFSLRFEEVLAQIEDEQKARDLKREKERQRRLKIQKVQDLLVSSEDFPAKEVLQETIEELLALT